MAYKQPPLQIKLLPGSKINTKKAMYPTNYIDPRMNMSIDQYNELPRKKIREIYKKKLKN
jgi:hypothetical protein